VPLAPVPTSLIFCFLARAPSDISPAVASPSLAAPPLPLAFCWPGMGVVARLPLSELGPAGCFFTRLCDDSLPLDSERFGDPGRLSDFVFLAISAGLGLPEGVVLPLEAAPDATLSFGSALTFALAALTSSSFLGWLASSFFSSSSSLCGYNISTCHRYTENTGTDA